MNSRISVGVQYNALPYTYNWFHSMKIKQAPNNWLVTYRTMFEYISTVHFKMYCIVFAILCLFCQNVHRYYGIPKANLMVGLSYIFHSNRSRIFITTICWWFRLKVKILERHNCDKFIFWIFLLSKKLPNVKYQHWEFTLKFKLGVRIQLNLRDFFSTCNTRNGNIYELSWLFK